MPSDDDIFVSLDVDQIKFTSIFEEEILIELAVPSDDDIFVSLDVDKIKFTVAPDEEIFIEPTPDVIVVAAGNIGPPGEDGGQGPPGTVGPQGPPGPTGAASTVPGPPGSTGPEGPQGSTGPAGADSTVPGPQGPKGDTGNTGSTGTQGLTGPTGSTGPGVPVGGTTGQALVKKSNTDLDTQWAAPAAGGASYATTITELNAAFSGSPPNGAQGILRPAGTSDDITLTYNSTLSKWVSGHESSAHINGGGTNPGTQSQSWRTTSSSFIYSDNINGASIMSVLHKWRERSVVGLIPQFRWRGFLGSDTAGVTAYARQAYKGVNIGGALAAAVEIPLTEQTAVGSVHKLCAVDWQDIPAGFTVADYLYLVFALKSNGTNNAGIHAAMAHVRWVG